MTADFLAAAIFVVDLSTPLGVELRVLYVIPLLVGALIGPPRFLLVAAGVSSALTVIGTWASPAGAVPQHGDRNPGDRAGGDLDRGDRPVATSG